MCVCLAATLDILSQYWQYNCKLLLFLFVYFMQISYLIFPVCAIFQEKDKCVIYLTSAAVIAVVAVIAVMLSENKHFKISHIKHMNRFE